MPRRLRTSLPVVLGCVCLAAAVRLVFALAFPTSGGDWPTYSRIAENILRGCGVSLSAPGSPECIPHFGGNHLPGFPLFVAGVWWLFDHSDAAIRVVQIILYCLALARLIWAVEQYGRSRALTIGVGLVVAVSPLQIAWPRFTETESLSIAVAIWFFAEILASLVERRLRALPIATAIVAAVWLRWDGLLLCIPVACAAFYLHPPLVAVRRGALVALVVALPLAGWVARNWAVGIPFTPPYMMITERPAPLPVGYAFWAATWSSDEYQRMGWCWPLTFQLYRTIELDDRAFDSDEERDRVNALLARLGTYEGQPFPTDIDAAFGQIGRERASRAPLRTFVMLPARRALALWSNPWSSFAWPNEMPLGDQERLTASRSVRGLLNLAMAYPLQATSKTLTGAYRYLLTALFLLVLMLSLLTRFAKHRPAILLVAAWVLSRTLFFAITNNVETRFTAVTAPAMELAVVLGLSLLRWHRRPEAAPADGHHFNPGADQLSGDSTPLRQQWLPVALTRVSTPSLAS
jgi:hypothetical protein